jgi:outer membrane biosynthesis protein TonB
MMNRLQKKCVIASTGVHLLLVVILFVGSGFFSGSKRNENAQELQFLFVPDILTANGPSGGGNPKAAPPAARPSLPAPRTPESTPEKVKDPDPPKDRETRTEKATTTDPNSYEKKKKLTAQDLKMVNKGSKTSKSTKKSSSDDQQQKEANARKQTSDLIRQMAGGLSGSSATKVDDSFGPGGGGPSYASYASRVQMVYLDAWAAPEDASSDSAMAEVSVTIRSDGTVVTSKFLSRSGDAQVDSSVQRTLNRVNTMGRPFPEGMKEKERTYILHFDLKLKRGLA